MAKFLGTKTKMIVTTMARKLPKVCRRAEKPFFLELKDYREKRWKRPNRIKPGTRSFPNRFSCKSLANHSCKRMKKKLNVKDCRVKEWKTPTKIIKG